MYKLLKKNIIYLIIIFLGVGIIVFAPVFFDLRSLTSEEYELLKPIYGESVRLEDIKIRMGGPLTLFYPGITLKNIISFPSNGYVFSNKKYQALLVHEVCHVWQYQHFGLDYIPKSLWELVSQNDTYVVHYNSSKKLRDYDIEEQCEIMADIFLNESEEYLPYLDQLNVE